MNEIYTSANYSDSLVAYVDILGFCKLISQDTSLVLSTINSIDSNLRHVLAVLKEKHGIVFSTKLFSDCICISCQFSNENLFNIVFELAYIQYYLTVYGGVFLRGALSRGNHFENERMIFSEGLLKAYDLERTACYPRIIVDDSLVTRALEDETLYFPIYTADRTKDFLLQAPDDKFFVDYLHILHQEGLEQIDELDNHKVAIESEVERNHTNTRVVDKYRWLAEYHNWKVREIINLEDYYESYATEVRLSTVIEDGGFFHTFRKK